MLLLNTSTVTREAGTIQFLDNKGASLRLKIANQESGSSQFRYDIPLGGTFRLLTDGSPPNVSTGWVEIIPDADSLTPAGLGLLSLRRGGTLVTEAGSAAVTPTTHAIIYVNEANGHDTGLAIANPKTSSSPIVINAYRADGGAVMSTSSNLAGEGHDAKSAWQLMPGALLQGFTAISEITGPEGFVALALRALTNSRWEYLGTAVPITDLDHFVPGPLIFPQVADGGGYEAQFVFLSSGASPTNTLNNKEH